VEVIQKERGIFSYKKPPFDGVESGLDDRIDCLSCALSGFSYRNNPGRKG
jgi:hypothetical protein